MGACLTPVLLEPSAPVFLMVPGNVESAQLATLAMVSSVKILMRYKFVHIGHFLSATSMMWCLLNNLTSLQLNNLNCFPFHAKNSARKSQTLASSLMVCIAVRTQTLATTVCPALLATRGHSHLVKVWNRLLLRNRQVQAVRNQQNTIDLTKRMS